MDVRENRSKKPLCHSVIVSESYSNLGFNDPTLANNLTVNGHKERQFNLMKRSCMPGSGFQESYAGKLRTPN